MKKITAFPYFGGKNKNSNRILEHLPPSFIYIEPFAGGLGIFLNKKPRSRENVLNDADGSIINFYKVLRERPEELARAIAFTPYGRKEFQKACTEPVVECDIETARRTYIRISQSMLHTTITKSSFALLSVSLVAVDCGKTAARILEVANALRGASLEDKDGVDIVVKHSNRKKDTLIYCDPPYLPETRKGKAYTCEMSLEDHKKFLEASKKATCMIAISGYDSKLYEESLSDWRKVSFKNSVHAGNWTNPNDRITHATECLWMNYPENKPLNLFSE